MTDTERLRELDEFDDGGYKYATRPILRQELECLWQEIAAKDALILSLAEKLLICSVALSRVAERPDRRGHHSPLPYAPQ